MIERESCSRSLDEASFVTIRASILRPGTTKVFRPLVHSHKNTGREEGLSQRLHLDQNNDPPSSSSSSRRQIPGRGITFITGQRKPVPPASVRMHRHCRGKLIQIYLNRCSYYYSYYAADTRSDNGVIGDCLALEIRIETIASLGSPTSFKFAKSLFHSRKDRVYFMKIRDSSFSWRVHLAKREEKKKEKRHGRRESSS